MPSTTSRACPGIGEKGARDLIATHGSLDALLARGRRAAEEVPRGAARSTPTRRARAANWCHPHRRAVDFDLEALRYRGPIAPRCFALFSRWASGRSSTEFAPTADTVASATTLVDDARGARASSRRITRAGRCRAARRHRRRVLMRAGIAGLAFRRPARARPVRPVGRTQRRLGAVRRRPHPGVAREALAACSGRARRPEPSEGRARPEVRRDRARAARRRRSRLAGFDTMLASYLLDATRSAHPLEDLALEHARLQGAQRGGRLRRARRRLVRALPPRRARLRRRARRPRPAAGATLRAALAPRRARPRLPRARAAARPVLATSSGRAFASTRRCWPAQARGSSASWRANAPRASSSWPARSSTSTRRSSSPRSCSRS
jgi:hypothetical protein